MDVGQEIMAAKDEAIACLLPSHRNGLSTGSGHAQGKSCRSGGKIEAARSNTDTGMEANDTVHSTKSSATATTPSPTNQGASKIPSLLYHKVQIDSGHIHMSPMIDMKVPLTQFSGEQSSDSGPFIETVLEKIQFSFGKPSQQRNEQARAQTRKQLTLRQLAELPESVRMRIIMCIPDLGPFEKAMGIRKESNPFMKCRKLNKAIVKKANAVVQQMKLPTTLNHPAPGRSKRKEMLDALMSLDDDELEELMKMRQQRRQQMQQMKSVTRR